MKYREFGSTGLRTSEIAFGAGDAGGLVFRPDRRTSLEGVAHALECGINCFDTSPKYGGGQSEENLGWILKELKANPIIATKFWVSLERHDDIPGEIARSVEGSLKRLQRDSVDILQLHLPVTRERGTYRGSISVDDVLGENGVVEGLERLRQRGLVRFFGCSGFGDTEVLHRLLESGHFHSAQAYYNLLNPSAGRHVPDSFSAHNYGNLIGVAADNGVGVLNIRAFAAGAILGQNPPGMQTGISPGETAAQDMERGARLREALGDDAGSMAETALRFNLMNPGVSCVVVGFSKKEHIDAAVAAADMEPLPDRVMRKLDALYASDFGAT